MKRYLHNTFYNVLVFLSPQKTVVCTDLTPLAFPSTE
jgi:hypothetical protein